MGLIVWVVSLHRLGTADLVLYRSKLNIVISVKIILFFLASIDIHEIGEEISKRVKC